jgi:hypothetical protein
MTRSLAVAAGVAALAFPSAASAASLTVSPQKRCYGSGESLTFLGTGFTPTTDPANPNQANVTRPGTNVGLLNVDANGAFSGVLTVRLDRGRETRTYTATDLTDPSITASTQITVSSVLVGLRPTNGPPGRILRINAHGFTTGKTLWAHVRRGRSKRNLKLGRLSGACGNLRTRRRLLPRDAAVGVYTVQFDTFRRYKANRAVRDAYTITVTRF